MTTSANRVTSRASTATNAAVEYAPPVTMSSAQFHAFTDALDQLERYLHVTSAPITCAVVHDGDVV
jgi:hypothetical protein